MRQLKSQCKSKIQGRLRCLLLGMAWSALGITQFGSATTVDLQFSDGSVAAKPVYEGDYFLNAKGQQVKVYRKQGVFVMPVQSAKSRSGQQQSQRVLNTYVERFSNLTMVRRHNLPGAQVLRLKQPQVRQASDEVNAGALASFMPNMMPVFTTEHGFGDLMLLPKVTVDISLDSNAPELLAQLERRFKLKTTKRLALTGQVYSMEMTGGLGDPAALFATVRAIGAENGVNWAEPQFFMKAQKAQFVPNDNLYSQQWNLNNLGFRGSRCDADCDALNAWQLDNGAGAATGAGSVIAIIDDGVQLDHPEFVGRIVMLPGIDMDFVDDTNTACGDDGNAGQDANPSPSPVVGCVIAGDAIDPDNHGTAVAGIAAAGQGNGGVVGTAFNASILPIRAISEYEVAAVGSDALCDRLGESVELAAQHADVINLSWTLPFECSALTQAIERTTRGEVTVGTGSLRSGGSPVVAASGNSGSGWVRVSADVSAGEHAYEWRYLRTEDLNPLNPFGVENPPLIDETVWIDDIQWPGGAVEDFESLSNFSNTPFTTEWVLNQCNDICAAEGNLGLEPVWGINTNPDINYARSGSRAASLLASDSDCGNSYLHTLRDDTAGEISFWVWVSANTQDGFDRFEFLIDGEEVTSYGDLAAFGFVDNQVGYPASLSDNSTSNEQGVIAVGASTSGDLSGNSNAGLSAEYRAPYSQFGPELDVVAPSNDQHLGITTTDRFSSGANDNLGFNTSASTGELSDRRYTQNFGGTSAAAPVVSGIAAAMIASNGTLSAQDIKNMIQNTAEQIGNEPYVDDRNDQFGHGRVNMFMALQAARGQSITQPAASCAAQSFDYNVAEDRILPQFAPQAAAGFCPAQGPIPVVIVPEPEPEPEPEDDGICFPVVTAGRDSVAVICL